MRYIVGSLLLLSCACSYQSSSSEPVRYSVPQGSTASSFVEKQSDTDGDLVHRVSTTQTCTEDDCREVLGLTGNETEDQISQRIANLKETEPYYLQKQTYLGNLRHDITHREMKWQRDMLTAKCEARNIHQMKNWIVFKAAKDEIRATCKPVGGGPLVSTGINAHPHLEEYNGELIYVAPEPTVIGGVNPTYVCPKGMEKESIEVTCSDCGKEPVPLTVTYGEIMVGYMSNNNKNPVWVGVENCSLYSNP